MAKAKRSVSATSLDPLAVQILGKLLEHFTSQNFGADKLNEGYEGLPLSALSQIITSATQVDFDLAFKQLEDGNFIGTGPMVPYENTPDSGLVFLGMYSKREFAYLTESGYRAARNSRPGFERF